MNRQLHLAKDWPSMSSRIVSHLTDCGLPCSLISSTCSGCPLSYLSLSYHILFFIYVTCKRLFWRQLRACQPSLPWLAQLSPSIESGPSSRRRLRTAARKVRQEQHISISTASLTFVHTNTFRETGLWFGNLCDSAQACRSSRSGKQR